MIEQFPTFRLLSDRFAGSWTTSAQRQALLRLIAVAAEDNLQLAPLLEAWATDEGGLQQRRLLSLAQLLNSGSSLPDAVEAVPGILREDDVLAIRFGAQSGALAPAIREVLAESQTSQTRPSKIRGTFEYVAIVLLIGAIIVGWIEVKTRPALRQIFADYGMSTPVFRFSWEFDEFVKQYWYFPVFVLLLLFWFTFSARPGRFLRRTFLGRFFYPLQELRAVEVLKSLSIAAAAGRPMTGALSTLARYHFDPRVRNKLLFVRNEVEQGADIWQSMAHAGLVTSPEARVLETAEQVGNRPWALERLAANKELRTKRRLNRWSELLLPVLVAALGVFVLFEALSLFVPLTKLLESQM